MIADIINALNANTMSLPLLGGIGVAVLILGFFVREAVVDRDPARLKSIASEFVAVFAAVSIGIWIGGIERDIERSDALRQRQEERDETALALHNASISYMKSTLDHILHEDMSVTNDVVFRPNVIESFVNSPEAVQRFGIGLDRVTQAYLDFLRVSDAAISACGATWVMYASLEISDLPPQAADRWVYHIGEYSIESGETLFSSSDDLTVDDEMERINRLIEVHNCVVQAHSLQIFHAARLLQTLCHIKRHTEPSDIQAPCREQPYARLIARDLQQRNTSWRVQYAQEASRVFERYFSILSALNERHCILSEPIGRNSC